MAADATGGGGLSKESGKSCSTGTYERSNPSSGMERVMENQAEMIKSQQNQLSDKDQRMNEMLQLMQLQGQQIDELEKRRKTDQQSTRLNADAADLQRAVGALQTALQGRNQRISQLTAELQNTTSRNARLQSSVSAFSQRVQDVERDAQPSGGSKTLGSLQMRSSASGGSQGRGEISAPNSFGHADPAPPQRRALRLEVTHNIICSLM
eukprot:TRINITY_DN20475_c0_g1_i6.p2 TRINITY_DN20475_c0_g1~~TRINITY_DN20475_c0_g1_i6.p2  ORF type:complete len:209 (+),score=46.99 TRINITY_DN20475_c0_g1_i6:90-716(+)